MTYTIIYSKKAYEDLALLKKSEPKAHKKVVELIKELYIHPKVGTGKPELLRYSDGEIYSRRITQKHRLVYSVHDDIVTVIVIAAKGHYNDK